MFKKSFVFVIVICIFTILSSCNSWDYLKGNDRQNYIENENVEREGGKIEEDNEDPEDDVVQEVDEIREQMKKMTLDEKIGQMTIVGLEGYTINEHSKEMIDKYHAGGFIILGENVKNTNQLLSLLNSLKSNNSKNTIPLFLSVDEEGGRVSRMPDEFEDLPSNQHIGKVNDEEISYKIGTVIAEEIKSFGFNMNFAPVLDINSNPDNPVIGERSFGLDLDIVSRLGIQTMKGIQSENIIPVVKHFPGHGDTSVDSHIDLPIVNNDFHRLESFELVPFVQAINNNADAIMIAHVFLPKVDSDNPVTMSKVIITDILRNQLNFNGIIISDDMAMGAIVENYDIGDAAVKAVLAGSDIILVAHTYENQMTVISALKKAVEVGKIPEERIEESVYRILKLKQKYKIADQQINSINVQELNKTIGDVLKLLKLT